MTDHELTQLRNQLAQLKRDHASDIESMGRARVLLELEEKREREQQADNARLRERVAELEAAALKHRMLRDAAECAEQDLLDDGSSTFPTAGHVERVRSSLRTALDLTADGGPWSAAAQPPITGESNAQGEYRTHCVQLRLCEGCLLGKGSECHTPACALCWHDSPGPMPIWPELYLIVQREP